MQERSEKGVSSDRLASSSQRYRRPPPVMVLPTPHTRCLTVAIESSLITATSRSNNHKHHPSPSSPGLSPSVDIGRPNMEMMGRPNILMIIVKTSTRPESGCMTVHHHNDKLRTRKESGRGQTQSRAIVVMGIIPTAVTAGIGKLRRPPLPGTNTDSSLSRPQSLKKDIARKLSPVSIHPFLSPSPHPASLQGLNFSSRLPIQLFHLRRAPYYFSAILTFEISLARRPYPFLADSSVRALRSLLSLSSSPPHSLIPSGSSPHTTIIMVGPWHTTPMSRRTDLNGNRLNPPSSPTRKTYVKRLRAPRTLPD